MAKVKFNAPCISFECEGEEKLVENTFKEFAEEFSGKVKENIAVAEASENMEEMEIEEDLCSPASEEYPFEDVKIPKIPLLSEGGVHTYADSWNQIVRAIKSGLEIHYGDSFIARLKDGRECELVCIEETDDAYRLESRDCLGGETSAEHLDKYLQDIYDNLPDGLKDAIKPTKRKHRTADGAEYEREEMIFVPAQPEMFPEDECYGDEGLYEQLEWYKNPHNRVRAANRGESDTHWYWCSSPTAGNTTYFCGVGTNGTASYNDASNAYGIAPFGCYISKS